MFVHHLCSSETYPEDSGWEDPKQYKTNSKEVTNKAFTTLTGLTGPLPSFSTVVGSYRSHGSGRTLRLTTVPEWSVVKTSSTNLTPPVLPLVSSVPDTSLRYKVQGKTGPETEDGKSLTLPKSRSTLQSSILLVENNIRPFVRVSSLH